MILVCGTTGQLGRAFHQLLGEKAYCAGRDEMDFTKPEAFEALIERVNPTAIINAVAYTQVDQAESEPQLAHKVNAVAPETLARLATARNIPFVHFSTDYVFNGSGTTPFTEQDTPAPLNVYGQSKLAGEQAVQAAGGNYLIFRTSWVFDAVGQNFFITMLRLGKSRESLTIVADQTGAPSYAPHLASASFAALQQSMQQATFPSGLYHLCNQGETSWHGFAQAIFNTARQRGMELSISDCSPIPSSQYPTPATRPYNSRLDCRKLAQDFNVALPNWQVGMDAAFDVING